MLFEAVDIGPLTGFLEHGLQSNGCTVHVLGEALVDSLVPRDRLGNDDGPSAGLPLEVGGGDVQRLTILPPLIPAQGTGQRSQVNKSQDTGHRSHGTGHRLQVTGQQVNK